jgi:hypothetical protein
VQNADHINDPVLTAFNQSQYVKINALQRSRIEPNTLRHSRVHYKIATPSLSYEPATDRDMYPGTIAMNAAAYKPAKRNEQVKKCVKHSRCAPDDERSSRVNRYVANAVSDANVGAKKTQMLRILSVILSACKIQ